MFKYKVLNTTNVDARLIFYAALYIVHATLSIMSAYRALFCQPPFDGMLLLSQAQADKGIDVIVENLANVNIDRDLELAAVDSRIAVSKLGSYSLRYCVYCLYFKISALQTCSIRLGVMQHNHSLM